MKRVLIFLAAAALTTVSCQHSSHQYIPRPSDSLYTSRLATHIYQDDPERALVIIDSAYIVGNVSEFKRDLVRATIYGRQYINPQKEKSLEICLQLLQHDSTQALTEQTAKYRADVLRLVTDIYRLQKNYDNYLKYSLETAELNRTWGFETESLRTEAEIALALSNIGRKEEGLRKLDDVREALSAGAPSVDRLDAWIVATKREINLLDALGRQEEIARLAREIIDRLDNYQAHREDYAEDSFRLPPSMEDRNRWCDYYRAQAHGFLGYSHALTGNKAEARKELAIYEKSNYGRSLTGRRMICRAWVPLGEWDKLMSIDNAFAKRMGADTLNADYATILHDRSEAAKARGNYRESLEWMQRYSALKETLSIQLRESQAQEYAAKYHRREQEMAVAAAKAEARKRGIVIIGILVLFALAAFATIYYARQRRILREKNQMLVRMINQKAPASRPVDKPAAHVSPERELFLSIDAAIRGERLYADAGLQRQDILDRWNIRRQTLNDIMGEFAGGESFPSYINGIRLEEALRLLREEPGLTIGAVARSVGFTHANFRAQFKQRYAITPAEYRENL